MVPSLSYLDDLIQRGIAKHVPGSGLSMKLVWPCPNRNCFIRTAVLVAEIDKLADPRGDDRESHISVLSRLIRNEQRSLQKSLVWEGSIS